MSNAALLIALACALIIGGLIIGGLIGWLIGACRGTWKALDLIEDLCDQADEDHATIDTQAMVIDHLRRKVAALEFQSNVVPMRPHDWLDPENTDVGSRLRHPSARPS